MTEQSGYHRTLNNAVFNTLPWAVSAALALVFTPYIVHGFGVKAYGVLSVVFAIVGYLSFLDLNLESAVVKYVAEYQAAGSIAKLNAVIGITVVLFAVIGISGGLALLLSASKISHRLLNIDPALVPVARSAISIEAVGFLATLFFSAATGVVNGLNRFHVTGMVKIISSVLICLGTVLLVKGGCAITWVVLLDVVISLLGVLTLSVVAKRLIPGLRVTPDLHRGQLGTMLRFCGYTSLSRFSYLMHFKADRIVAGVLLGVADVTFYTVATSLIQRIMDVLPRLAYVIYPLVSELQGRNDLARIRDVYLNASRIMLVLATAITLPLLIFGKGFLAAWMGSAFEQKTGLIVQLSTLALYLIAMTQVPSLVLNGLGRVRITGLFSVTSAGLFFALMYPLTSFMGVSGIAASLLVSRIVMVPIFLTYTNRTVIGVPMGTLLGAVYMKPIILGCVMWLLLQSLPLDRVHNAVLLVAAMGLTGVVYLGAASGIGAIESREREAIISYLNARTVST